MKLCSRCFYSSCFPATSFLCAMGRSFYFAGRARPWLRQQKQQAAASTPFVYWMLSLSLLFACTMLCSLLRCCVHDAATCKILVVFAWYLSSSVFFYEPAHATTLSNFVGRHRKPSSYSSLSPPEAGSIWRCSVHSGTSCGRGLPRSQSDTLPTNLL